MRQPTPAVLDQLGCDLGIGRDLSERDERLHAFAHLVIGDADDCYVGHEGMSDQDVLGFLGVDVDPAGDDHVRGPVGQVDVAVLIHPTDVAVGGPAPVALRAAGLLRIVVVLEATGGLEPHLAGLAGRQLVSVVVEDVDGGGRSPDRARVLEPFGCGDEADAERFGPGVVLVDDRSDPLDHVVLHRYRAWRGSVDHPSEARQVVSRPRLLRQPQQSDEVGGDELRVGDPVAFDRRQRLGRIESFHDQRRGTKAVNRCTEAERRGVIQRRWAQVHRRLVGAVQLGEKPSDRVRSDAERCLRQRLEDALRLPGRARRVQHQRAGSLVDPWFPGDGSECGVEVGEATRGPADHEAGDHTCEEVAESDRDVGQVRRCHERLGATVVDDVAGFLGSKMPVDRRQVEARSECRPQHHEELRLVAEHQGDMVPRLEACVIEDPSQPGRTIVERCVAQRLAGTGHHDSWVIPPPAKHVPMPFERGHDAAGRMR